MDRWSDFDGALADETTANVFFRISNDASGAADIITDDCDEWLKVKERLALEIKKIVEKNNASFAFPSQSIYVEKK